MIYTDLTRDTTICKVLARPRDEHASHAEKSKLSLNFQKALRATDLSKHRLLAQPRRSLVGGAGLPPLQGSQAE